MEALLKMDHGHFAPTSIVLGEELLETACGGDKQRLPHRTFCPDGSGRAQEGRGVGPAGNCNWCRTIGALGYQADPIDRVGLDDVHIAIKVVDST